MSPTPVVPFLCGTALEAGVLNAGAKDEDEQVEVVRGNSTQQQVMAGQAPGAVLPLAAECASAMCHEESAPQFLGTACSSSANGSLLWDVQTFVNKQL